MYNPLTEQQTLYKPALMLLFAGILYLGLCFDSPAFGQLIDVPASLTIRDSVGIREDSSWRKQTSDFVCQSFDITRQDYRRLIFDEAYADNRFADYQGLKIVSIEFSRVDVFDTEDPKENNGLFRLVNYLNIRTRESALRPQLLFKEGDFLDPAAVAETERNLRESSYLANAYIMPVAYCRDGVHLLVVSKDAWTTQPIITASQAGGQSKSKVGLVEGNFLGLGSEVSVVLTKDDQRSSLAYRFKQDFLWGQPLAVGFGFSDNSDGYVRNAQFGKPFYTESTLTAFDASLSQLTARLTVEQNENELVSYDTRSENKTAFAAIQKALFSNSVTRLYGGFSQSSQRYSNFIGDPLLQPTTEEDLTYPWLALEQQSTRYIVAKNINTIGLVEDLRLGAYWRLSLGYSPERSASSAYILSATYNQLFNYRNQYLGIAFDFSGTRYDSEVQNPVATHYNARANISYFYLMGEKQRIFWSAQYAQVRTRAVHETLRVGGLTAIRGYPANYALGDKVFNTSLEYRYHSDIHIFNIIRVGAAAYIDVATLKNTQYDAIDNQGYNGELLSGVGFGLRIASSKTNVGNVVHIDIAKPVGYQKNTGSYQVLLSARSTF